MNDEPKKSRNRISYVRPGSLPGVEVLRAVDCTHCFRAFHTAYTVGSGFFHEPSGVGDFYYRGKASLDNSGVTMLMEPGEILDVKRMTSPVSFRVLILSPELVNGFARETGWSQVPVRWKAPLVRDAGLARAAGALHAGLESGADAETTRDLFHALLAQLLRSAAATDPVPGPDGPQTAAIEKAALFLKEHWAENIYLERLAGEASLSRFHFLRQFAQKKGLPPHAYQTILKVAFARDLLAKGVRPSRAAMEAGFSDQSHLTRHFKRTLGVTPAQYADTPSL